MSMGFMDWAVNGCSLNGQKSFAEWIRNGNGNAGLRQFAGVFIHAENDRNIAAMVGTDDPFARGVERKIARGLATAGNMFYW